MHAKVTVADDTVFVGSFNLSRSGEMNAENVLELRDPELADRMAAFVDAVRGPLPGLVGARAGDRDDLRGRSSASEAISRSAAARSGPPARAARARTQSSSPDQ